MNPSAFRLISAITFLSVGVSAAAQGGGPIVRASLASPGDPATVGQATRISVEVFTPSFFTQAPTWPDTIDVDGAVAKIDDGRAININDRINGSSYAGIRREYVVYPLRPGDVTVPPIAVTVVSAGEGARPLPPVTLETPPLVIHARLPPGADPGERFVSASAFDLTQRFDRSLRTLKVGDALTRTITMTAQGSWSAMLPPVSFDPVEGTTGYPSEAVLNDRGDERGGPSIATRVERETYVFTAAGNVSLPAVDVRWWDATARRMRTARLPLAALTIAPAVAASSGIAFADEEAAARERAAAARAVRQRRITLALVFAGAAIVLTLAVWLVRRIGPRCRSWWIAERRRRAESEHAFFRHLAAACRTGEPRAAYRATLAWLDRAWEGRGGDITLERAVKISAEADLERETRALTDALYARRPNAGSWSGDRLLQALSNARPRILAAGRDRVSGADEALPPLNPS